MATKHENEMNEEEYRKHMARERGEDYVHPDDHAPADLRRQNARLAIFHELGPRESEIWQKCGLERQNDYADLVVNGLSSGAAAQRFFRDSYLPDQNVTK